MTMPLLNFNKKTFFELVLSVGLFMPVLFFFYNINLGSKICIEVRMNTPKDNIVDLYYDIGTGFRFGESSIRQRARVANKFDSLIFPLPDAHVKKIKNIRINPSHTRLNDLQIKYICIRLTYLFFKYTYNSHEIYNLFSFKHIPNQHIKNNTLIFNTKSCFSSISPKENISQIINNLLLIHKYFMYFLSVFIFIIIFSTIRYMNRNQNNRNLLYEWVTIVFFLFIISFPLIQSNLCIFPKIIFEENRKLAIKPTFNIFGLNEYINKYEAYFNDNFDFRIQLVALNNIVRIKLFNISPYKQKIIIGKNGWLFPGNWQRTLDDYRGLIQYSTNVLEKYRLNFERLQNHLRKLDIPFILVVGPDKHNIYPEFMPDRYTRLGNTRLKQVTDYLKLKSDFQILDLNEIFLDVKNSEKMPLYYRTDSHWNSFGGLIAYREIMKKIAIFYPNIKPLSINDYTISLKPSFWIRDLANFLPGVSDYFYDESVFLELNARGLKNKNILLQSKIKKALIMKDSFYTEIKPYLEQHFEQVVISGPWNIESLVEKEKPHVVILECVERTIESRFLY